MKSKRPYNGLFQKDYSKIHNTAEWDNVPTAHREKIMRALEQANNNETKPLSEVMKRIREKYQ